MPREMGEKLDDSHGLKIIGEVLISVMMILFFTLVLALVLLLCLRSLSYRSRQHDDEAVTDRHRRRRRHRDLNPGLPASTTRRSLDPSVLNSIPVLTFSSKDFKDTMECAVCLSETKDGEKVRNLPNCNHRFHVDCIDMWFQSNSTCPICRNSVSDQPKPKPNTEAGNSAVFPTDVLVWGTQGEVTNSRSNSEEPSYSASSSTPNVKPDEMVIEIPRQIDEDEETKSPVMKQLKSLKRLLSRGTRSPGSSTDPGKMSPAQRR